MQIECRLSSPLIKTRLTLISWIHVFRDLIGFAYTLSLALTEKDGEKSSLEFFSKSIYRVQLNLSPSNFNTNASSLSLATTLCAFRTISPQWIHYFLHFSHDIQLSTEPAILNFSLFHLSSYAWREIFFSAFGYFFRWLHRTGVFGINAILWRERWMF